jgi:hypothetical protein
MQVFLLVKKTMKCYRVLSLHEKLINSCYFQNMNSTVHEYILKGQRHEMVVEVRPWSGRLGLN